MKKDNQIQPIKLVKFHFTDSNDDAIADAQIVQLTGQKIAEWQKCPEVEASFRSSNSMVLNAFRLCVKLGEIEKLVLVINNTELDIIDEDGKYKTRVPDELMVNYNYFSHLAKKS